MNIDYYINFIKERHGSQTRKQGTPYYLHPVSVCECLAKKGFANNYLIAGLFHDLLEDTKTTYEEILNISNYEVAEAVRLVTKEEGYNMREYIERIKQNDIAKMVKLADRWHNLSESIVASSSFQKKYIKETEDWYIDLAKGTIFEEDINKALDILKKYYYDHAETHVV
ncbi:MAG: bifunctional (p)ppGpp synthetase/guanosine-3',5'-bis(diphosphate) 3'-pyrophosphohydrolase [Clostridia bacterium]|nr:bifunctional (p)ppGpp synthetase/guanosine-3',5'-bis(diphosphate) 3'-pyrophosphohydrolase [Clostridia bacterium]